MAGNLPVGTARQVNRAILTATFAFGAVALAVLIAFVAMRSSTTGTAASIVYGVSLLICSLCSYFYNMHEASPHRRLLRLFDHGAIFLLIAGTYTPFVGQEVLGPFGVSLLIWVWGLALLGILLKLVLRDRHDRMFVALYIGLGWLFLSALSQFVHLNPLPSLVFLAIGGFAYTAGAVIYGRDIGNWTDPVWHGCVLAGSSTHFVAVILLLAAPQVA